MRKTTWLFASALLFAAGPALAQPGGDARFAATTLDVSAHGETRVAPDMASIDLGVVARGDDAAAAMAANAQAMTRVIAALHAGGVTDRDIQTSSLSLSPQYAYPQGQPPRLTGYEASNQLTLRIEDLARLGQAVDTAVHAGATTVSQISFGLKDRSAAADVARLAAVKSLQAKAALYAQAAGYRLGRLVNLSETGGGAVGPPRPMMAMAVERAAAPTPVESGELTVSVDLTGEYELSR